jgi:uncharacterized protein YegJ (DUF2314 family)
MRRLFAGTVMVAAIAGLDWLIGCELAAPPPPSSHAVETAATPPRPSDHDAATWQQRDGSMVLAQRPDSTGNDEDDELARAIARARATAEDARRRWEAASPQQRAHWAVKWASPTVTGAVEHVWVRPIRWSAFRIEGILDSPPLRELACGKSPGDAVSFPIEELSDWLHSPDGDFSGRREGGFTIDALDRRQAAK